MNRQEDAVASNDGASEVDELRRDIERTQGELGGTIDAIQEKLSPGALMAEARGPVEDTTDHIVAEVQRAVQESVDHLLAQARQPVEDVSDHLIERATGAVEEATERMVAKASAAAQEATDHMLESARVAATETVSNIVAQTGQAVRAATRGKVEKMASKIGDTTRGMADSANDGTRGLASTVIQTIQRNPFPAALATIGIGWLYLKRPKSASVHYAAGYTTQPANGNGYGVPAREASGSTLNAAGLAIGGAASTVGDAVTGAANSVGGALGDAAGSVSDTVGGTASAVGDVATGAAQVVGGTVGHMAVGTQDAARNLVTEVQFQALRIEEGFRNLAQQNPLAFGAAGLALGSLVGLAILETQAEHKLMGGARDAVLEQAGESAHEALAKVGHVAVEASKTAKEEAAAEGLVSEVGSSRQ